MAHANNFRVALYACAVTSVIAAGGHSRAQDATVTREELRALKEQNQALQDQLRQQQNLIESLNRKVNEIQTGRSQYDQQMKDLKGEMDEATIGKKSAAAFSAGKVSLSAEGAMGYFQSGSAGTYPDGDFR